LLVVLVMVLRRQNVAIRYAYFPPTPHASINAREWGLHAWGVVLIKSPVYEPG
jgi:hypothetical protein